MHGERLLGQWFVPAIIPFIVLGISLSTLLSGRTLDLMAGDIDSDNVGGGALLTWSMRLISLTIVSGCTARILASLFRKKSLRQAGSQFLFVVFIVYWIANCVLNSLFGSKPIIIHNSLYAVFVIAAVYLSRNESSTRLMRWAKVALVAMLCASLLTAAVRPQLVFQTGYASWIPGLNVRFWGLGSHANSMGPLALLVLILEYFQPSRWRVLRLFVVALGIVVLALAQSKTAWIAALMTAGVVIGYHASRPRDVSGSLRRIIVIVVGLVILAIALVALDSLNLWDRLLATEQGAQLASLSGRTQAWNAALSVWRDNIFFGYGPRAWSPEHRLALGLPWATSAHNQFMQALSEAGLFGAVTLVLYTLTLAWCSFKVAVVTRGASLALFTLILVRSMTEAPMAVGSIMSAEFVAHLILFAICVMNWPARVGSPAPEQRDGLALRFN